MSNGRSEEVVIPLGSEQIKVRFDFNTRKNLGRELGMDPLAYLGAQKSVEEFVVTALAVSQTDKKSPKSPKKLGRQIDLAGLDPQELLKQILSAYAASLPGKSGQQVREAMADLLEDEEADSVNPTSPSSTPRSTS